MCKPKKKHEKTWLFDCKYQPGLAFGPLLIREEIEEI